MRQPTAALSKLRLADLLVCHDSTTKAQDCVGEQSITSLCVSGPLPPRTLPATTVVTPLGSVGSSTIIHRQNHWRRLASAVATFYMTSAESNGIHRCASPLLLEMSTTAGLMPTFASVAGLAVSVVANGTFGVCHKICTVPNEIFVVYHCLGAFLASSAVTALNLLLGEHIGFTPFGLLSGFILFIGLQFVFKTIELSGFALASAAFAGAVITVSLIWELISGGSPSQPLLLVPALALIVLGLVGCASAQQLSVYESDAYEAHSHTAAHREREGAGWLVCKAG